MVWGFWVSTPPSGSSQTSAASWQGKIIFKVLRQIQSHVYLTVHIHAQHCLTLISKSISVAHAYLTVAVESLRKPNLGVGPLISLLLCRKLWIQQNV